jgi:hypothetical protein
MLLSSTGLQTPADFLDIPSPSREWLSTKTQELNVFICSAHELDFVRRHFCDHASIAPFFANFRPFIEGRFSGHVFSMHEMQLSALKTFNVLVGQGRLSLADAQTKLPHITGVCTVSAGGAVFRPMIILKQLENLETLAQFTHLASFASSASGWITSDLFAVFAIDFCAQLSVYRLSLPPALAGKSVLLILAAEDSRMNLLAAMVFRQSNVDVLVLPGCTTQVLHPVETTLTAPLNARFKDRLRHEVHTLIQHLAGGEQVPVDALRCLMVAAFLDAFRRETIPFQLRLAFEATGWSPFNPDRHQVPLAVDATFDGVLARPNRVSGQLLTDPNTIAARFAAEAGRPITDEDVTGLNIDEIWNPIGDGVLERGRILTQRPTIWLMENETSARLI